MTKATDIQLSQVTCTIVVEIVVQHTQKGLCWRMKLMLPYPSFQEKVKEERNAMDETEKRTALKEFQGIPGVGKTISLDLWNMGFRAVQDLQNQDPEDRKSTRLNSSHA